MSYYDEDEDRDFNFIVGEHIRRKHDSLMEAMRAADEEREAAEEEERKKERKSLIDRCRWLREEIKRLLRSKE